MADLFAFSKKFTETKSSQQQEPPEKSAQFPHPRQTTPDSILYALWAPSLSLCGKKPQKTGKVPIPIPSSCPL
jgi:hypothetical protein